MNVNNIQFSKKQKIILTLYTLIVFLCCLIPPWKWSGLYDDHFEVKDVASAKISLIFTPPDPIRSTDASDSETIAFYNIDTNRLVVEVFGLTVLFGALFLLNTNKKDTL